MRPLIAATLWGQPVGRRYPLDQSGLAAAVLAHEKGDASAELESVAQDLSDSGDDRRPRARVPVRVRGPPDTTNGTIVMKTIVPFGHRGDLLDESRQRLAAGEHLVDQAVLEGLRSGQDLVAVDVL